MSNPDPNLPPRLGREGRRHIGPLVGMALVVVFGLAMIFWWLTESAMQSPGPGAEPGMTQEEMMAPPATSTCRPLAGGLPVTVGPLEQSSWQSSWPWWVPRMPMVAVGVW